MKEFGDDNFKFEENVRKFSKRVEKSVGKEVAPMVFPKDLYCRHVKSRATNIVCKGDFLFREKLPQFEQDFSANEGRQVTNSVIW